MATHNEAQQAIIDRIHALAGAETTGAEDVFHLAEALVLLGEGQAPPVSKRASATSPGRKRVPGRTVVPR